MKLTSAPVSMPVRDTRQTENGFKFANEMEIKTIDGNGLRTYGGNSRRSQIFVEQLDGNKARKTSIKWSGKNSANYIESTKDLATGKIISVIRGNVNHANAQKYVPVSDGAMKVAVGLKKVIEKITPQSVKDAFSISLKKGNWESVTQIPRFYRAR